MSTHPDIACTEHHMFERADPHLARDLRRGAGCGDTRGGQSSMSAPAASTRENVCPDHAECARNANFFHAGSECMTCERRPATHFLSGETGFRPRCDECLVSSYGCPHATPNVCPECFDFVTMELSEEREAPLPLVIHCPQCHLQHVDVDDDTGKWATSRLHRKHLCKPSDGGCGHVWAPANVHTVGVAELPGGSA